MRGLSQDDGAVIKIAEPLIPELAVLVQYKELHPHDGCFPQREGFIKSDITDVTAAPLSITLDDFVSGQEPR